jgi:hypothetical protein
VRRLVREFGLDRLATLTYADGERARDRDQVLEDWEQFARRLREWDPGVGWVRVLEVHKDGERWHVHVAVSRYIPKGLLRRFWPHGFVDIRRFGSGRGLGRYLAKYIAKAWGEGWLRPGEHAYDVRHGMVARMVVRWAASRAEAVRAAIAEMGGEVPAVMWGASAGVEGWLGPPVVWMAWP